MAMSTPLECPDDLLILRRRRALTAAEERVLAEHLESCDVCRMSLALHSRLEPLPTIGDSDAELSARWVSRTLAPRAVPQPRAEPEVPVPTRRYVRRRPVPRWLVASAALVLLAGAAGATVWRSVLFVAPPEPAEAPSPAPAAPRASRKTSSIPATPPAPPDAPPPDLLPAEAQRPAPAPVVSRPPPPRAEKVESGAKAAELFVEANRARRRRQFDEAARLYQELQADFPSSGEARLSLLSLAELWLAQGRADDALQKFDAYLASPGATLAEEAMVGRARALGQLGQKRGERAAWQVLLDRYPKSTYAWRARQRIEALDANEP
jgi:TolA-binding protein